MNSRFVSIFVPVARGFFVVLMLSSATGKLLDMPGFYGIVSTYQMLPNGMIPPAAWALTLFELALGVALCTAVWRQVVWVLLPLHLFYLVGLSQALVRGLVIPNCGCFGVYWGRPLTPYTLLEDIALLTFAYGLYRMTPKSP